MTREWLIRLRGDRSQREIGDPHGIGSGYISLIEQGKVTPGIDQIPKLAEAYGVEAVRLAHLFMFPPPPRPKSKPQPDGGHFYA